MNIRPGYTFDDVLLIPKYSSIKHRAHVHLYVELSKDISVGNPIIPANMLSISSIDLFKVFYNDGSLVLLHRFWSIDKQIEFFNDFRKSLKGDEDFYWKNHWLNYYFGFSVGVQQKDYDNLPKLIETGAKIICVDIAHGDSKNCLNMVCHIAKKYPNIFLIAGNVCTPEGAEMLWNAGADAVKAGVGSSMVCSTRVVAASGYPQLSMLDNIYSKKLEVQRKLNKKIFLIADGGCRFEADFCKSLCFADLVMSGGYFAGSDECPGETIVENGQKYKRYDGSSTLKNRVEGVKSLVKSKGSVKNLIDKVRLGLESCCSYQGVSNLANLKINPQFVSITNAGLIESHPHDVKVI